MGYCYLRLETDIIQYFYNSLVYFAELLALHFVGIINYCARKMQQLMKKLLISGFLGVVMFFNFAFFASAATCTGTGSQCALQGMKQTNEVGGANTKLFTGAADEKDDAETWITGQIGSIIGNILAFVGVIFMALILYAGYLWMTAGGDAAKTTKAISIMTDAVVGLIVISAAYLLTQYVGNVVLGNI